jgi:adhesin transport system membrane fusion protein
MSKPYLGDERKKLYVKVGMVSEVDIITGKKTILQYLLKPIVRGIQNSLSEN